MGCCLVALIGATWPRLVLALLWLFSSVPGKVFQTTLWPLLGFFFLPTTTLGYELLKYYGNAVDSPLGLVVLAVAFLHDMGQLGMAKKGKRVYVARRPERERFVDPG